VHASPLDLIRLIAPTTTGARLAEVVKDAEGFLYLVARLGVTGASARLAGGLEEYIARVRAVSPLPLAVGFGISSAEQARTVAHLADGVVVGSALVERLGRDGPAAAGHMLSELRAALDAADRERPR
jgi:tryptophan synthase alpha chain